MIGVAVRVATGYGPPLTVRSRIVSVGCQPRVERRRTVFE